MGCGSSTEIAGLPDQKESLEPENDPPDFPYVLEEYPPPMPSRRKKNDIFRKEDFGGIDKRAKEAPLHVGSSFNDLFTYLFGNSRNTLEKVRAIYCWIGYKNQTPINEGTSDSPNGIMRQVQASNMSFSYAFARLCREANIPCVIIRGISKGASYEVGDTMEEVQNRRNKWNAAYVAGEWRIVSPFWSFQAVTGHSLGRYTLVESKGKAVREKEVKSDGTDVVIFNEYYFLTDPDDFVTTNMAIATEWQLVAQPYDLEKFTRIPLFKAEYFKRNWKLVSEFSGRIHSPEGIVKVGFREMNKTENSYLTYKLFFNDEESSKKADDLPLDRCVFMEKPYLQELSKRNWTFEVRSPEEGVYKLSIYSGDAYFERELCHFKLYCKKGNQPLPVNTKQVGWGPNRDTEKAGLVSASHTSGSVYVKRKETLHLTFKMTKTVSIRTELLQYNVSSTELNSFVSQKVDKSNKKLNVDVNLPSEGEYALQFYAKDKHANTEKNICNYLVSSGQSLHTKKRKKKEDPIERRARQNLQQLTAGNNLEKLSAAIEEFLKYDLEDKGDLAAALKRQEYLQIQKGLHDAILRRHIATLDRAIEKAQASEFRQNLQDKISEAEDIKDHLVKLNKFAHDILAMKQPTVSELHRYKEPRPPIKDVMTATYLLLGEHEKDLKKWEYLRTLMRKTGMEGLILRVSRFDTDNVPNDHVAAVQGWLDKHDEETIRLCSPAAGTFYVWAGKVIAHIVEKENKSQHKSRDKKKKKS